MNSMDYDTSDTLMKFGQKIHFNYILFAFDDLSTSFDLKIHSGQFDSEDIM